MRGLIVLAIVWMTCLPQSVLGAMCPVIEDSAKRTAFIKAEKSPPRNRGAWGRLRRDLGDYPLFPYLELAGLRAKWPNVVATEIEAFLKRYEGEPVTFRIKKKWLRRLARGSEWRKFIALYSRGTSVDLQCHHARAMLETGDESGAFTAAERLWLAGKSQPKECDPVFAVWLKSDRFSAALAWERIGLAMARGNVRLVRYLERFLESDDRQLAAAWRKVHKNPQRIGAVKLRGDPSRVEAVLAHGLERLARRDPDGAVQALREVQARVDIDAPTRARVARRIGLAFASQHDPRAVDWLWRVDAAHTDIHMLRWRIAAAVLHARWNEVIEGVASMPDEERDRERWRYWRARALEATGETDEARADFESLAQERDYYGFLAADRLEMPYRFNHRPLDVADETVERVAVAPALRRALEFLELERRIDARREWQALVEGLDEEDLKAASWIARCRNWHGRAILTIARTPERDDLELRFPVLYPRARRICIEPQKSFASDRICVHSPGKCLHAGCPFTGRRTWADANHAAYRAHGHAEHRPEVAQQKPASGSRPQRGPRNALYPFTAFEDGAVILFWRRLPTTPVPTGSGAGSRPTAKSRPPRG